MLFNLSVSAQNKLAIIVDKDGFANLREYPNLKSQIIDSIKQNDFVYCDSLINDWYKVWEYKWYKSGPNYGKQFNGYIHKSRIKLIENFTIIEQQKIILKTLNDYNNFITERNLWYKNNYDVKTNTYKDSTGSIKNTYFPEAGFDITDNKFDPILGYIETYYCTTHDIVVLSKLFSILYEDQGSANEQPAWSLGKCFVCSPTQIVNAINNMDKDKAQIIKGHIYFGLAMHFKVNPEDSIQTNKDYLKYIRLLENKKK
jgi:hypothetical protein